MPKTAKTAKTNRSKKTARRVAQVERALDRTQTTIDMVRDVTTRGLRFGLGLGAYLLDTPKNLSLESLSKNLRGDLRKNLTSFVETAINKGEKIEKQQLDRLMSFEQEQRNRVKEFLQARRKDLQRTEASLEDKIEEVISSLDIPTRQDIHQLNRRMNELSKELSRQRPATRKGSKRAKQTATATQSA